MHRPLAYAVEDQFPAGWTVTSINHGGELDLVSRKVKWGPFCDATPRPLQYQVVPPTDFRTNELFVGVISCDGVSTPMAGNQQSHPSCRLSVSCQMQEGRFDLALTGLLAARFQIEGSSHLVIWTPLTVLTNTQGRIEFTDPNAGGSSQRFYRGRLLE